MGICDSEENRRKLAWLVPGYILLAWFFCVLFQPLSIHSPAIRSRYKTFDKNYEVIYMDATDVCNQGEPIILGPGIQSGVIIRLSRKYYDYEKFNCSLEIRAGDSLDGLVAVVEEMDLREHEDDFRQPGGHWGSSVCLDYLEIWTDTKKKSNKVCGTWDLSDNRIHTQGNRQNLFGHCYENKGKSRSCEARSVFINAVIDAETDKGRHYGLQLESRDRRGFSVVVTGFFHPKEGPAWNCGDEYMSCPFNFFADHDHKIHCIWQGYQCDGHQNCGFSSKTDEMECSYPQQNMSPWSVSTMSLLIVVYMTIVLILILVTILLLRWHKALRSPVDVIDPADAIDTIPTTAIRDPGSVGISGAPGNSVSIMVMYRPKKAFKSEDELPPSYDSLYMGENPPSYNVVTVNLPPDAEATAANCQPGGAGTLPVPLIVPCSINQISLNAHLNGESIPQRFSQVSEQAQEVVAKSEDSSVDDNSTA